MEDRVVITGLGVCAPNGTGLKEFTESLEKGISGISFQPDLADLNFGCQIAGKPTVDNDLLKNYFSDLQLKDLKASGLVYGVIAGMDAWNDAGLTRAEREQPEWDNGVMFGTGVSGVDKFRDSVYLIDDKNVRRLGSTTVIQTMASGISAYLGGILGAGNQVTTNSSACTTGTESILMAFERIKYGKAKRILAGSTSDSGPYVWGGFDAMRILPRKYNDNPTQASRPMSATAAGFVPGSGAGALVLESLDSALKRNAHIYAEVLGGHINSGGQTGEGSMTAPNSEAVQRCIKQAMKDANVQPTAIDSINGHLTATTKDSLEIENWSKALERKGVDFPYVNSFKSLFGHCLSAAGSIECIGAVLQFQENKIFGNINCEDIHPSIASLIAQNKIPQKTIDFAPEITAKASFGFGDVNACVIFKRYKK
ncbi:beta-ketoacyl-[acyl-carrier-protein] synthase family protein [Galbibacter mesophilus]|uniref:beta-ketoacyl-[acyl-carrier-protein] synthase family protein n=1 Tax=Galbibacter mesophilus TaxID=379069 RepID=UPI00191D12CD|nr:beta-ketoacyl-[acyl-carrier-protein] synthase family protein [Galbibacter mesophilus]MCM5663270.1 beta-ketoacyl-[acyl-carrier-protein] synthase family protein [Galbibacter mesophilus]